MKPLCGTCGDGSALLKVTRDNIYDPDCREVSCGGKFYTFAADDPISRIMHNAAVWSDTMQTRKHLLVWTMLGALALPTVAPGPSAQSSGVYSLFVKRV